MTVHLLKLCVGVDSLAQLKGWYADRTQTAKAAGGTYIPTIHTRNKPKRLDEILDGGSLYWIIKGQICGRQRVLGLETDEHDGRPMQYISLDPEIVDVEPSPRRAFQGWRYLETKDAPKDLGDVLDGDMPDHLRTELIDAGVW